MIPISTYMGTTEPQTSKFGASSNLSNFEPSTTQVLGAYISETFTGEGSLYQDIKANNIEDQEESGRKVTEDAWKDSESFRDGLSFHDGMTESSARTLASVEDDRQSRKFIIENATDTDAILGFGAGFISGIAEPKNLLSGVAAAVVTGGAGVLIPSLGRMIAVNSIRGAAGRGAVEGVVAAGLTEPSNLESSRIVQGDYTMADSIMNLTLGTVLGAGIGAGAKAFELRRVKKGYQPLNDEVAVQEFDTALTQTVQGEPVNVEAVKELHNLDVFKRAKKELEVLEARADSQQKTTGIKPVTELPEFKAWFGDSKVVDKSGQPMVVYHGTASDIKAFEPQKETKMQLRGSGFYFSTDPNVANKFAGNNGGNLVPVYVSLKRPMVVNLDSLSALRSTVGSGERLTKHLQSKGFDGLIFNDRGSREIVAFKGTQIKSVFNRGKFDANDPRLINVDKLEKLEIKKGKAKTNTEVDIDQSKIKELQDSVARVDSSTAYDLKDVEEINTFLKNHEMDDFKAVEKDLEVWQDEITQMIDEGNLSKEELESLTKLADIDEEVESFAGVLNSAKNCLIRG